MTLTFAKELRRFRISERLTLDDFGKKAKVNSATLRAWETGRALPNFKNANAIFSFADRVGYENADELEDAYTEAKTEITDGRSPKQ